MKKNTFSEMFKSYKTWLVAVLSEMCFVPSLHVGMRLFVYKSDVLGNNNKCSECISRCINFLKYLQLCEI